MKSKITLVILLVIIIFLGALSFYFGYEYFKTKDEVNALNSQVDILKNEQVINEQNSSNTENEENQVVEVLSIPKFDSSKVDTSARESAKPTNIKEIGNYTYEDDNSFNYMIGPAGDLGAQINYKGRKYNLSDKANIVDVAYQSPGYNGANFVLFLLDDGTIKYTFISYNDNENTELEIKDYNLINVVALKRLSYTGATGKIIPCVGAITSDGITHLISSEL